MPDPDDRRSTCVVLTDEGVAAQAHAARGHVDAVRQLVFSRLTPTQVSQLESISQTILDGLTGLPGSPASLPVGGRGPAAH